MKEREPLVFSHEETVAADVSPETLWDAYDVGFSEVVECFSITKDHLEPDDGWVVTVTVTRKARPRRPI